MNRILKFPWGERHKHFFTSDWHVFHDPKWEIPIWESRGYLNAQDAAERILDSVNRRVLSGDYLWYLGDTFLNATDDQCRSWLSSINCQNIKKIWGNHHSNMFRMYKEEVRTQYGLENIEVYPLKMGNVEFIGNQAEIRIGKQKFILNHFPLHNWNTLSRGSFHLHGHSHSNDLTRNPEFPLSKTIDCSWDYKKDVWSVDEIIDVMSTKEIYVTDHHRD